jgi:hypothetical protein
VDGLLDRTSRPNKTRSTVDAALLQRIEQLRRAQMPMRTIAPISSRPASGNGLTAGRGSSAPLGCRPSWPTTTPADHTRPSAINLRLLASAGTTYCNSAARLRFCHPGPLH